MRIFSLLAVCLFVLSVRTAAQNLPEQNCPGAIPVCQPVYSQANSYTGYGDIQELDVNNQGCLNSSEKNCVWYIINVTSSGTLEFTITPNNLNDDYDFAVWDVTGVGCSAIYNYLTNTPNPYPPLGCNYSGVPGQTGLSNTIPSVNQWSPGLNVTAGQTLVLNVSNYSSTQSGYTLDFSPSTASIYDTLLPHFQSVNTHCGTVDNKLNVVMSEPVKCNSIDGNGSNFYVTPSVPGVTNVVAASSATCSGVSLFTNTFIVQFAGTLPPGTYWLHAQQGNDGNSLLDNCGNEQVYSDSIQFVMIAGNPPQMVQLDTPACIKARLILDRAIDCSTVDGDGSDFFITGPSAAEVVSAQPYNCNVANMTDTIDLIFNGSIAVAGTYILNVKTGNDGNGITDTCGIPVSNTISWVVSDKGVDAIASPDLLCDPGYVTLSAVTNLHPVAPNAYTWQPAAFISDSTANTTLAYVNQSSAYYVTMLDEDYCYRRDTTNVILSIRNPVVVPGFDTSICFGDKVHLDASGGVQYVWYPATALSCTECPDPVANPQTTTQYFVVISDQYNCADTLPQTVVVDPLPIVDAGPDKTIYFGESVRLAAGSIGNIYLWEPSKNIDYNEESAPTAMPTETTTYYVTVIDSNDCRSMDSVTIFVRSDIPVVIPSGFTPNGDGKNDVFRIGNTSFHKLQEFRIFNRWGQEIFNTNDAKKGWDGTFNNVAQEAGVYNYLIKVSYPDGRVETFKGDVTLIR